MRAAACVLASLVLAAAGARGQDQCRPTVQLQAEDTLTAEVTPRGPLPRLEATLALDVPVKAGTNDLGLGARLGEQVLKAQSIVLERPFDHGEFLEGKARLSFAGAAQGHAVVRGADRNLVLPIRDGVPLTADGTPLEVRPPAGATRRFVLLKGARVRKVDAGNATILAGSTVAFGWPAGDPLQFRLGAPARFDETGPARPPQRLEILRPQRVAPGGSLVVLVAAAGTDFRTSRLNFCFATRGAASGGTPVAATSVKFVGQAGDTGRFEVRVPEEFIAPASDEGLAEAARGLWERVAGTPARLRVLGFNENGVALDAAQGITVSNPRIAIWLGVAFLAAVSLLAAWSMGRRNPLALFSALVMGKSGAYSLSNLQVLMWTILVLFALAFTWSTTGELLEISNGILVLLGISGGTSVLTRIIASREAAVAPGTLPSSLSDLVVDMGGRVDLLRVQMLGFTSFTWLYALASVLRSQGLPEIPESLYWLMGISNGAYVGGKVPGIGAGTPPGAAPAVPALTEAERALSPAEVQKLQASLGVPRSGIIDDATREAVRKFKLAKGIVPASGHLDRLLLEKVAAETP